MEAFDKYVKYQGIIDNMTVKRYEHSYRVSNLMGKTALTYGYGKHDIELAKKIGLLHDIGKFKNILEPEDNMNYVDRGIQVLFANNLIEKFEVDEEDYDIVKNCIKYHNKYSIDNIKFDDDKTLFFLYLLRDCDKLDIINMWTSDVTFTVKSDGEVSEEVKKDFDEGKMVHSNNRKTNADNIVELLSFVYDLNYINSVLYIYDNELLEKLYNKIDNKEGLNEYFNKAIDYINRKTREERGYARQKVQSFGSRKEQV